MYTYGEARTCVCITTDYVTDSSARYIVSRCIKNKRCIPEEKERERDIVIPFNAPDSLDGMQEIHASSILDTFQERRGQFYSRWYSRSIPSPFRELTINSSTLFFASKQSFLKPRVSFRFIRLFHNM